MQRSRDGDHKSGPPSMAALETVSPIMGWRLTGCRKALPGKIFWKSTKFSAGSGLCQFQQQEQELKKVEMSISHTASVATGGKKDLGGAICTLS